MAPQSKIPNSFFSMVFFSTLFFSMVFFSSLCDSRSLTTTHSQSHSHASSTSNLNLNQFEGYRKGHQGGLLPIKAYLHRYGYLDSLDLLHLDHDQMFDDELESAVLTYQWNFHLNATGMLDSETLALMMAPRCGCPDIINGTNTMARRHHATNSTNSISNSSSFGQSKYTLPGGQWGKNNLNVVITDTIPSEQAGWVRKGLAEWQDKTNFYFTIAQGGDSPDVDIRIEKFSGDHGDGSPFDGPGSVLAHASLPVGGQLHFDADEAWTDGAAQDMFDMVTVAVHEMGHILGLGHTSVEGAVMYPSVGSNQVKSVLQQDDLDGIEALYPGIVR